VIRGKALKHKRARAMDISEPLATEVGFQKESLAVLGHFTIARAGLPLTLAPVRERGELFRAQATRAKASPPVARRFTTWSLPLIQTHPTQGRELLPTMLPQLLT
jgi:hypothetical protein